MNRLAPFERRLCSDARCRFVDLRRALAPSGVLKPGYSTDGTRLSWPAYVAWGNVVREQLGR